MPVSQVFVSYRTDDSVHAVIAIYDRLASHFGREHVFRDQDSLALGSLYPGRIRRALRRCDIMLAVIGPHWLDARDPHGDRRIDNPRDWVRLELRTAFERGIPVVPALLDSTALPGAGEVPSDISALAVSTYWQVRHQSLDADVGGLITRVDTMLPGGGTRDSLSARDSTQSEALGYQSNTATRGATVYAVQGGSQTINNGDGNGKRP